MFDVMFFCRRDRVRSSIKQAAEQKLRNKNAKSSYSDIVGWWTIVNRITRLGTTQWRAMLLIIICIQEPLYRVRCVYMLTRLIPCTITWRVVLHVKNDSDRRLAAGPVEISVSALCTWYIFFTTKQLVGNIVDHIIILRFEAFEFNSDVI